MPARFVYWMNVSLDLYIDHPVDDPENPEPPEWLRIDEQLHREFNARARGLSMMVQGRVVYEIMDPFWPNARGDESLPDFMREYGQIWTDLPKILVSRTRTTADHNTRVIGAQGDDAIAQLAQLRETADGDIGVGGANLATQLLAAGLLDELLLFVHPAILGGGRPLFDTLGGTRPLQLDLLEQKTFDSGVTMNRLQVRR